MKIVAATCLNIFLSSTSPQATPDQIRTAKLWSTEYASQAQPEAVVQFWNSFNKQPTPEVLANNLRLELSKFKVAPPTPFYDVQASLIEMSAQNKVRFQELLSQQLAPTYADAPSPVEFIYARVSNYAGTGVFPPMISARELIRNKFGTSDEGYYSSMAPQSATVGFKAIIHKRSDGLFEDFKGRVFPSLILKNPDRRGLDFMIPTFYGPMGLIQFFSRWNPQLIEEIFRTHRFYLPKKVQTVEEFIEALDSSTANQLRLDVLHHALKDFIFTPRDFESLYNWALERGLHSLLPPFERRVPHSVNTLQFLYLPAYPSEGALPSPSTLSPQ